MSLDGNVLGQRLAGLLLELREHARRHPDEVEAITCALVAHLRSWRPESVLPMTWGEPTETPRDPRD